MSKWTFPGAALWCSALISTQTIAQADDHLIVPGSRVGRHHLGMTATELYALKGDPIRSVRAADGSFYEYDDVRVFILDKTARAVRVCAKHSDYRLTSGLTIGSSELLVKASLQPAKKVNRYSEVDVTVFLWNGLMITVKSDRINEICVS